MHTGPPSYSYELVGDQLRITAPSGTAYQLTLPCPAIALAIDGEKLFLACGTAGLATFSLKAPSTPELLDVRDLGGKVTGFHVAGGQTWVEVARTEARPLGETMAAPPVRAALPHGEEPAPTPEAPPTLHAEPPQLAPEPPRQGRVERLTADGAVIDLGAKDGLAPGSHIELYLETSVVLAEGEAAPPRATVLAVGEVIAAGESHAEVRLGIDERVPETALCRPTRAELTATTLRPPRPSGIGEVSFTLRPFLTVGTLGAGTVSDGAVGLRLEHLHVEAVFEPLGIGIAKAGNIVAAAGNLVVAYDTTLFEIGLGAGWATVNDDVPDDGRPVRRNVRSGLSIVQAARLGAVDGLRLTARNTFLLYGERFHYGGTVGELQVPLSDRSWGMARGGGGTTGFGYGEIGLKWLMRGRGLEDSTFLTVSLGYGGLAGEKKGTCLVPEGSAVEGACFESVSYSGPMVGLGILERF